ncbi:MAG: ABC transporter ATP-binding protein [Eubacterium sp.]|nr:ABC transporter ATP-binding protein [Eubacterium sp.]
MITGIDIVKDFDGLKALDGASFTVETGSVYGLVGPNGSGKSTLIRHIMGIFEPDAGTLNIDGETVFENPSVKAKMAYVPDDTYYMSGATVTDMAKLYAGVYPGFDRERLGRLLEAFPAIHEKSSFRKMSKGMQKQASVLLALSCRADILVLDEPMDGLDPLARHNIWKVILESVAEEGTTVLVSSHNLRELEDVCDHIGIMDHGRIIDERDMTETQGDMVKCSIAYEEERDLPGLGDEITILHQTKSGRMFTLILRGDRTLIEEKLAETNPVFVDYVPLTLEEIFIHEVGGENDAIQNILG